MSKRQKKIKDCWTRDCVLFIKVAVDSHGPGLQETSADGAEQETRYRIHRVTQTKIMGNSNMILTGYSIKIHMQIRLTKYQQDTNMILT